MKTRQPLYLFILGLVIGLFGLCNYAWVFSLPPDSSQGDVQKIMYIHVPAVFSAYLYLTLLFGASLGYLLKFREGYDIFAQAAAEIATLNLVISLWTGAVWGKPTWNTYWTWDARLTLTLVIFLLYAAYLIYRKLGRYSHKVKQGSALLAILGFFSIPLNHMAVTWFRSLHQPSTLFAKSNKIDPELLYPLLSSFLFFLVLFLYIFYFRVVLEKDKRVALEKSNESTGF